MNEPRIIEESKDRLWFCDGDSNDEVDLFLNSDSILELDVEGEEANKGLSNNQARLKLNNLSMIKLKNFLNELLK